MSKVRISKKLGKDTRLISTYSLTDWIFMTIIAFPFKAMWWMIKLPFVLIGKLFGIR